jgi:murein DD-endopeptidase MepM/ murein hydrolase activator NlpD
MQQKVSDAEAAGKDPLAAGAYYRQDLNEETLRHIVREALKRKLLKEMNSSFLVASPEEEAEMARSIEDQMQKDYIDSEYGEGAYDASQLVDTDVSYVEPQSPLEEPLSHPAEIDSYWKEGTLRADEVSKFAPKLSQLSNQIQSHSETGEFLVDGKPLSEIDPDLNRFAKWSSERTLISPLGGAQHGTREDDLPRISSTFGPRFNPLNPDVGRKKLHRALDIGGAAAGTKFLAPATGIVVAAGADAYPGEKKGKGNYLIIKTQEPTTGKWLFHKFFHLNKEPNFKKGEAITQGQQLGEVGNTGSSTGAHLHWQVHRNSRGGARVDPAALMAQAGNIGWEKYAYKPSKTAANESQLRYAIQEALKRKLSPLKEVEEISSALLYQVVLVLSVSKPIRDIAGKLNRIRAIEGVTIVSHERDEDIIHRGDVVAKIKFHPISDMMTPMTYINQYLVPQINSSKLVPEVKVLKIAQGTLKEI